MKRASMEARRKEVTDMLTKWNGNGLQDFFFREFPEWSAPLQALKDVQAQAFAPAADIVETENELELKVDLPGHDPKSLQVKVDGDTLTISSERKAEKRERREHYLRTERSYGMFARSFVLPITVDGTRCEAQYDNGVLTITL